METSVSLHSVVCIFFRLDFLLYSGSLGRQTCVVRLVVRKNGRASANCLWHSEKCSEMRWRCLSFYCF